MRRFVRLIPFVLILVLVLHLSPPVAAASQQEQLDSKIRQIVSGIPASASDSEKALYLHDYIVKNVQYEMVGQHQSAYGALIDGKAVCAGYADAYLLLLQAVGIEARTITGTARSADGTEQSHAWTLLYLDGKCLYTDVTWDDPFVNGIQDPDSVSHEYYNLCLEQMNRDHTPDAESMQFLPGSCNHTGLDYYTVYQSEGSGIACFSDQTDAATAARYFRYLGQEAGKDSFYCEFRFPENAQNWITANWVDIARHLGLSGGINLQYQMGATVFSMTITGTLHSKIPVSSVSLQPQAVTLTYRGQSVQLTANILPADATNKAVHFASSDPSVVSVTDSGLITAHTAGEAIITVTSVDGGKTAQCRVTVDISASEETEPPTQPPAQPPQETKPPEDSAPTQPPAASEPAETGGNSGTPTEPTAPPEDTAPPDDPTQPVTPTDPAEPENTAPVPSQPQQQQQTQPAGAAQNHIQSDPPQQDSQAGSDGSILLLICAFCVAVAVVMLILHFCFKPR